jgi:hypothetical protein
MEMQQNAELKVNKPKMDSNPREVRASQQHLKEEMPAKLDAHHERMMARIDSQLQEMEACLGKTKARFGGKSRRNKV